MKVLKICTGTWENASRDQRELGVCRELGAETVVLAKGNAEDKGREETVNGFGVFRYTTRPYNHIPVAVNRILSIFQWAKYASTLNADIISGHDIGGWTIGWLSRFFTGKKKPKLVYDSHEFELGRNTERNKLQTFAVKTWERKVIRKSVFTIVVNDSIADELVKIYKLKKRPVVVRNIPDRWNINPAVCEETRKVLCKEFREEGYILIYHGAICKNRGIEELLQAVEQATGVNLLLLGNPESSVYLEHLKEQYINRLEGRVIIRPAVPHNCLWEYIGAADLCIAPIIPKCRSYYFALPNKLFEAIQAETPLLVSDLPEMKRIVKEYGIGETVNPEDISQFAQAIMMMKSESSDKYKEGLKKAKEELSWEKEKTVLKKAYLEVS